MIRECGSAKRLPWLPPAHRRGLTAANGAHVAIDELHRVVNREARRHNSAWRIDVQVDVLVSVFRLEVEQLCHDKIGHLILNRPDNKNESVLEKPRIDIVGAFAPRRLLNDHWYEI